MDIQYPLTVESLYDIVQSQLCLHNNKKLFVLPAPTETFVLSVNGEYLLDCEGEHDACINESSLQILADRLEGMDDGEVIQVSDMTAIEKGFQIGFKSKEDGFVETIGSEELEKDTVLEGE